jgi:dienelactone hydrolase
MIPISRRDLLAGVPALSVARAQAPATDAPHLGTLYPPIQEIGDKSPLDLSFLRPEFKDLAGWQEIARKRVFDLMSYTPDRVSPDAQVIRRVEHDDHIEERLTFRTTPIFRVPAHLLIPKNAQFPAPGIVALHSHDGIYMWGREKVVATGDEHPWLTDYKSRVYGGKSIAVEMVRLGYVVIAIDMFYWGERRLLHENDPVEYKTRPAALTAEQIRAYNRRSSENESLTARSLMTAGASWPGVMLWDDIRTLDYLATRPEVDVKRMGCVGLSVGGYRSFMLAALDATIQAAVAVGWMRSFASQLRRHTINSMGLSFVIPGMYRHLDLPDLAAAIAPRSVLVMNGTKDQLFNLDGVKAAFAKIAKCYAKAGAPANQECQFYDVPHQFNAEMQAYAWKFLAKHLAGGPGEPKRPA